MCNGSFRKKLEWIRKEWVGFPNEGWLICWNFTMDTYLGCRIQDAVVPHDMKVEGHTKHSEYPWHESSGPKQVHITVSICIFGWIYVGYKYSHMFAWFCMYTLYIYIYIHTYLRVCCWAKGCCGGGMMMGVYSCECGFSVVLRISLSCLCLPEKYQQWIVGEFQCTGILHGFWILLV